MVQSADGTIRVVADLGLSSVLMFMELRCAHIASKGCVVRQQTGAGGGSYRFTHIDPDSGAAVVVAHVDFPMRGWDLSPAGDEIAYISIVSERTGRLITIALADGVTPLDVPLYGHMQDLAYDPSGRNFIATGMINISPRYHIARVDRRGWPDLIWGNPLDWLSRPVVSPDGRHVGFTRAAMSQNLWLLSGL